MRREETQGSCRGPEWEKERWRARRSGIIRSLCGPLKRLRRKLADGTPALTHLGKEGTYKKHFLTRALPHLWDVLANTNEIKKMTNRRNK